MQSGQNISGNESVVFGIFTSGRGLVVACVASS
jgi:hypothetical protein